MSDVHDLPFDQYQRYHLVRVLLESVRAPGETFRILDVGGRTALLRDFLPDDHIELVDVDPSDVDGLVLGSGAQLPFQTDSVDVVAAFDTLEHVPPPLRDAFVAECARVSRRYVILAGPYDSPRVAEAEELLLAFLRERLQWTHRYLEEHRINGLPDAGATRSVLEAAGARVEMLGHGALDRWLLLMMLELYAEHEATLRDIAQRAYRLYNEHLFRTDHGSDVYRHAMVAVFGDAPVPHLRDALDPVGSAPVEATVTFRELGAELMRYDALRDTYKPEMERLHGVVTSLEKDRDEHAESLAVQGRDLEETRKSLEIQANDLVETKKTLDTVGADLEESRKTIEALRAEAERERGEVAKVLAETESARGAAEGQLVNHRKALEELNAMREGELAELQLRGELLEQANVRLNEQDGEMKALHDRLHGALERASDWERMRSEVDAAESTAKRLRMGLAAALAEAESAEDRRSILDSEQLSLEEELSLLVQLRDRRMVERDQARDLLHRTRKSFWGKIGWKLGLLPKA